MEVDVSSETQRLVSLVHSERFLLGVLEVVRLAKDVVECVHKSL